MNLVHYRLDLGRRHKRFEVTELIEVANSDTPVNEQIYVR